MVFDLGPVFPLKIFDKIGRTIKWPVAESSNSRAMREEVAFPWPRCALPAQVDSSWQNNIRSSLASRCVPSSVQLSSKQKGVNPGISWTQSLTAREIIRSSVLLRDFLKPKYSPKFCSLTNVPKCLVRFDCAIGQFGPQFHSPYKSFVLHSIIINVGVPQRSFNRLFFILGLAELQGTYLDLFIIFIIFPIFPIPMARLTNVSPSKWKSIDFFFTIPYGLWGNRFSLG